MLLRPRQKLFVERSLSALDTHRNTLGVAPTAPASESRANLVESFMQFCSASRC